MIPDLNRVRGYSVVKLVIETIPGTGRLGTGGKFAFRITARDDNGNLLRQHAREYERRTCDLNEALAEFLAEVPDLNEIARRGVIEDTARERAARQGGMREVRELPEALRESMRPLDG